MTPVVKRYAVITFLIAWLVLPLVAVVFGELSAPWIQIVCAAILAFIVAWVWLMVQAIRKG
jgi:hypothetical protein